VGFDPLAQIAGGEAAAGLGMESSGRRPDRGAVSAEGPSKPASCDTARPALWAGKPQKKLL